MATANENMDPVVVDLTEDERFDCDNARQAREDNLEHWMKLVPLRYQRAIASEPQVRGWVERVVNHSASRSERGPRPEGSQPTLRLHGGNRWLLITGGTGSGKTWQAWGALRAFALSGMLHRFEHIGEVDLLAKLRPRHGVDSEAEFARYANAKLLVLDDYGTAKPSEWVTEVMYRLFDHRHDHELATIITTNLSPKLAAERLDSRIGSRMAGMSDVAVLTGDDRRLGGAA